jgi:hypothetical protein
VAYLRARQATGGGFPAQPGEEPNAQSTAWAVQGLIAAGAASTSVDRGIAFLGSLTAPDGHIRYSRTNDQTPVWVTAEALLALERKPLPVEAVGVVAKQPRPTAAGHKVAHKKARRAKTARRGPAAGASQSSAPALTLSIDFGFLSALVLAPLGIG